MYRNGLSGFISAIPPVTKNLIIINIVVWAVEAIFPRFGNTIINVLGLHYVGAPHFNPVQVITYLFVHASSNPWHLLFNMFSLWMFGSILERIWGGKRYLLFYFVCGVGAAVVQEIVWASTWMHEYITDIARLNGLTYDHTKTLIDQALANNDSDIMHAISSFKQSMVTIGASGAVYGLLLGYAFVFPNQPLYLFFIPYPIKAKYMMIGYGVIEFFLGFNSNDAVAHFAHLGGMIFGILILLYWKKKGILRGNSFY
ncbi:MAG: rhomboid family intramembrane serine protease [Muribaculaceae bacterium]|nr:rhomboid family intramembrane serine protease [Muribaculaceae bacterium]